MFNCLYFKKNLSLKKFLFSLSFLSSLSVFPICAFAAQPSADFTLKSGIEDLSKPESTFDESRTLSGVADQGALILIGVYTKNAKGELNENNAYDVLVGPSGLFSQQVDLNLGENIIYITASQEGFDDVCQSAIIKRKNRAIKDQLENQISLPGSTSVFYAP